MAISTRTIIEAMRDEDLRNRLEATAIMLGVDDPAVWVASRLNRLITAPVDNTGQSLAAVYEYQVQTYKPAPRPGENPAGVTDGQLEYAVLALINKEKTSG